MKKFMVSIFALCLILMMASASFAGDNAQATFELDSNLNEPGYQGVSLVEGIEGSDRIGFGIFVKDVDELRTASITVTWDGALATLSSETGMSIDIERNVNGVDVEAVEASAGEFLPIETDDVGTFSVDLAKTGDALVATEYGLVYVVVLKTVSTFTAASELAVTVAVELQNNSQVSKSLGEKKFGVNMDDFDVQTSTWGEIKSQFKE